MYQTIKRNSLRKDHRIDRLRILPLTPEEYCRRWIPKLRGIQPDERGYRQACIIELARITTLKENTINTWGKDFKDAPRYVQAICRMADMLNQIREKATFSDNFPDE
ncbi:MAG: hypothetical protein F6J89_02120 [Symploca sp. SIO1C4]|uniref:Uncharacterized protein n=1 Tax=Symploca sp. SIO1C4 TaxID=2607765 RepID=A0A6B3N4F5_9CYAN|nr:hypothetical protein [Symploca sp. SIO1C4]